MSVSYIRSLAFVVCASALGCVSSGAERRRPMVAAPAPMPAPPMVAGTGMPEPPVGSYTLSSTPGPASCTMHPELVDNGIALVFTSRSGSPEMVRARVRELAASFERARARGEGSSLSNAQTFGLRSMLAMRPIATTTDTADGARLVLTAREGANVAALRASVIWHAPDLLPGLRGNSVDCPVVPGHERAWGRATTAAVPE